MRITEMISLLLQNLSDTCRSKLYHGIPVPMILGCQIQLAEHPKVDRKKRVLSPRAEMKFVSLFRPYFFSPCLLNPNAC